MVSRRIFHHSLFAILLFAPIGAEAQYRVNERRSLAWDHEGAAKFQVSLNSGPWTDIGLTNPWLLPVLPVGSHNVKVRACDFLGCGPEASLDFFILPLLPTVSNPRLIHITTPVSVAQAIEVAHSYSYLWRLVRLDNTELQFIASQYNGSLTPTLGEIINFLESVFIQFAR